MSELQSLGEYIKKHNIVLGSDLDDQGYYKVRLADPTDHALAAKWAADYFDPFEFASNTDTFWFRYKEDCVLFKLTWG